MVTHDPVAAAYTDRVVFLADGRVVDELRRPDREQVLQIMTRMADAADRRGPGSAGPGNDGRGLDGHRDGRPR